MARPLSTANLLDCGEALRKAQGACDAHIFRIHGKHDPAETWSSSRERGCRYVIVGKKTEQSLRRVPLLQTSVLPHLPKSINGPLFQGDVRTASKRLNRFLNEIGIADPRKVVHSLRHRAQDRLRAAGCPEDVHWAILGHELSKKGTSLRS
jgi:hypothetical protein